MSSRENLGATLSIWWAESAPSGWDRGKVSENLGATTVVLAASVVSSPLSFLRNFLLHGSLYDLQL